MLTVAVSVSAGAEAITSAVPALYGHQVAISVTIVLLLMMLNLRGLRESASFLLFPVYTFILVISLLIVVGLYNIVTGAVPLQATALPGGCAGCFYRFDFTSIFFWFFLFNWGGGD